MMSACTSSLSASMPSFSLQNSHSAFAPACVGNVGVGFDILGHTIDGPGDIATVSITEQPHVIIESIHGDVDGVAEIPLDPQRNTAGRALLSLREKLNLAHGFSIRLHKGIPLGSGMGGSAASCVAALVAANALLENPLTREQLYPYALDGESLSTGGRNGDNVAPMLLGGLVLSTPTRMLRLDVPDWLSCVVIHPHQRLETTQSREVLRTPFAIHDIVTNATHLALLLTGLQRQDPDLIREGLNDKIIEPRRQLLIPGFTSVKDAALAQHALGVSISGAGPSVFAWFDSSNKAQQATHAMRAAFSAHGIESETYVSPVGGSAAYVCNEYGEMERDFY